MDPALEFYMPGLRDLESYYLSNTCIVRHIRPCRRSRLRARNVKTRKVRKERRILRRQRALRVVKRIRLADALESAVAICIRGRSGEQAAFEIGRQSRDVGEDVALEDAAGGGFAALEGVAVVVLPDVVDGVQEGASGQGGGAAGCAGDEVGFQRDLVAFADHLEGPVVVAVAAAGRVGRLAVDVVVGERDAGAGVVAEDVVLAARSGGLFLRVSEFELDV